MDQNLQSKVSEVPWYVIEKQFRCRNEKDLNTPGLLGEGDVLGVGVEGHRFASVKSNSQLHQIPKRVVKTIFRYLSCFFQGHHLIGAEKLSVAAGSDKTEVYEHLGREDTRWTGGQKATRLAHGGP